MDTGSWLADVSVDVSALSDSLIDITCGQVLTSVDSVFADWVFNIYNTNLDLKIK